MRSRTNLVLFALAIVLFAGAAGAEVDEQILDLSFEDLLATTVTSASKRSQPLNDTATAVFVITAEDIRKSGATNIADALRMVPGLHVAQIDANKWAVTARGYNGRFSNKLLVLMDGRSVYTTSFSGVYWEVQDIMLEDLDRIEIIRGPGSTLWGANAVNGVINIITRNAVDTQDGVVSLATGDVYRLQGGVRAGARLGEGWFARAYAKARHHDTFPRPDGTDAGDDWRMYQTGFRVDSHSEGSDRYSFLANVYRGVFNQEVILPERQPPYASVSPDEAIATGHNGMARWQRTMSPTSEMSLQVYYDHTDRDERFARERNSQADLEFQHSFAADAHTIVWGTGLRFTRNTVDGKHFFDLPRASRDYRLFCAFVQDEIALFDGRVALTAGTKFENNEYTGNELQPSLRAMWKVADQHRLWGSASRAVRTPMRAEDEFRVAYVVIPAGTPQNPGPPARGLRGDRVRGLRFRDARRLRIRLSLRRPACLAGHVHVPQRLRQPAHHRPGCSHRQRRSRGPAGHILQRGRGLGLWLGTCGGRAALRLVPLEPGLQLHAPRVLVPHRRRRRPATPRAPGLPEQFRATA
jgi:iron complex outermembrane receptor protein